MEISNLRECFNKLGLQPTYAKAQFRSPYIKLCADKKLVGNSFWLAGNSPEIIDYLEATGSTPKMVWNCEVNPFLHREVFDFYATEVGCNMAPSRLKLHQYISMINAPIVYGHADFVGLVGSVGPNDTSTYTFELINSLANKLGDEAYLAFTHTTSVRSASKIFDRWRANHSAFLEKFPGVELNRRFINHPALLLSEYMAIVIGDDYQISVESSIDYPSSSNKISGGLTMNKTVIHLKKGELNVDDMLHSVYAHEAMCRSIKV